MASAMIDELRAAYASGDRVRILRDGLAEDVDVLRGIVVAVGRDWFMVAVYDDSVYFEGWDVARIADITAVEVEPPEFQAYARRAAVESLAMPAVPLALLEALALPALDVARRVITASGLIGVYVEDDDDPDVLFIGRHTTGPDEDIWLLEIDVAGLWHDEPSSFDPGEITRLTIGGRYQDALERYGEPFPGTGGGA
ncbi:MAG: hypothetical protein QM635_09255 [Microbacteriaceae bacterium]